MAPGETFWHPRACRILSVEHVYKIRKKLNARVLRFLGETSDQKEVRPAGVLLSAIFNLRRSLLVKRRRGSSFTRLPFLLLLQTQRVYQPQKLLHAFVSIYRPEYGRTTRRT